MGHPFKHKASSKAGGKRAARIMKNSGGSCGGSDTMALSSAGVQARKRGASATGPGSDADMIVSGSKGRHRYARGGRTKKAKSGSTNIAIVMPHHPQMPMGAPMAHPMMPGAMPAGGPPQAMGAGMPPGGAMPGQPGGLPGGPPPGMPMRARGGRLPDAGSFSGVERKEMTHIMKGKKK